MKKILSFFILIQLFVAGAAAQKQSEFSVVSFEEKPFGTAARDERYKLVDGNGELFSIIKLVSNNPDDNLLAYSFDFGLCESRVKEVDSDVWVYVQRNAMRATIKREGYKTVKYDLPLTVQPGRVYEMVLSAQAQKVLKQMVLFKISPASSGATVMYKSNIPASTEQLLGIADANGEVQENLPLGTYSYRVISKKYHISEGIMELNDIDNTYSESITLHSNYSTITLLAADDVEIFIDGQSKGIGQWTGELNAGSYNVECRHICYKTCSEVIMVVAGKDETIKLKPLEPINGALSIKSSPSGATITIDGKDYGQTPRNINSLLIGEHTIVISKEGYESVTESIEIKEDETVDVNTLLVVSPSLRITSSVHGASVKLNGKRVGVTPYTAKKGFLMGDNIVEVSKDGYDTVTRSIVIKAGGETQCHVELVEKPKLSTLIVKSSPSGALVNIDGLSYGSSPVYARELEKGTHKVKVSAYGYKSKNKNVNLNSGETVEYFANLKQKKQYDFSLVGYNEKTTFYAEFAVGGGHFLEAGLNAGCNVKTIKEYMLFNLEVYYAYGLERTKLYSYNDAVYTLSPMSMGVRGGVRYTIGSNARFSLVPQIGYGTLCIKGDDIFAKSETLSFGLRTDFMMMGGLGINLTPEYSFFFKKEVMENLVLISPEIASWHSGFGIRLGLHYVF